MFNFNLLTPVIISSAVIMLGCGNSDGSNANADSQNPQEGPLIDQFEGKTWPVFNPTLSQVPVPNDFILDTAAGDGTFIDASAGVLNPVQQALGELSGASLIAPIDIALNGPVTASTVDVRSFVMSDGSPIPNPDQSVFILELEYAGGDPLQGLLNSEPPTIPLAMTAAAARLGDASAGAALVQEANAPSFKASVISQDGTLTLRILPTKPLKPKTRYVVVVTDGVKDSDGIGLSRSPSYFNLSEESQDLLSPALAPLRDLVNDFWEPTAVSYFSQVSNVTRGQALDAGNIALSFSFTTSGDEKVLEYVANPTEWFNDQLTIYIRSNAIRALLAADESSRDIAGFSGPGPDGVVDYFDMLAAADTGIESFPDTATVAALGSLFGTGAPCNSTSGDTAITCASDTLTTSFSDLLPTPAGAVPTVTSRNEPVSLISAPISPLIQDTDNPPLVAQGVIELPYYLGIPASSVDGSAIQNQYWTADTTLADALNSTFNAICLALPQGGHEANPNCLDESGEPIAARGPLSEVVNYIYPFPVKTGSVTIPWLVVYPNPAGVCSGTAPYPTIIYQHGITTDRSAALSIGAVLADQSCKATIAIDLVAHGIAPVSTTDKLALAENLLEAGQENGLPASLSPGTTNNQAVVDGTITLGFVMDAASVDQLAAESIIQSVLATGSTGNGTLDAEGVPTAVLVLESFQNTVRNGGSIIPGIAATSNERHFNFTADTRLQPIPMDFDESSAFGASGSLYINLYGFLNIRDKNRQSSLDLLNLRESLLNFDLDGDGSTANDFDTSDVSFIGHSLGTVVGTPFVAVANSTGVGDIKAASLLTPASGLARMFENSPTFADLLVGGLAGAGLEQGSANYEMFLRMLQAALDATDPISFADNLNMGIDYIYTGSPYDPNNSRFQTSASDTSVLILQLTGRPDANGHSRQGFLSDQGTVIETETVQFINSLGTSGFPDLLSGSDALAEHMGASNVLDAEGIGPETLISRLSFGSHGMFILPAIATEEETGFADPNAEAVRRTIGFYEGVVVETLQFLQNGTIFVPDLGLDIVAASESATVEEICAAIGISDNCSALETEDNYLLRETRQLNE